MDKKPPCRCYLVQRVHHGHVAQQRHSENLCQQMSAQQVTVELVLLEICASHKNLGRQPVVLRVGGGKYGVVHGWSLLQLQDERSFILIRLFTTSTL